VILIGLHTDGNQVEEAQAHETQAQEGA